MLIEVGLNPPTEMGPICTGCGGGWNDWVQKKERNLFQQETCLEAGGVNGKDSSFSKNVTSAIFSARCVCYTSASVGQNIFLTISEISDNRKYFHCTACFARNCIKCHPQNPTSCLNCSKGYYSLQKRITGNVRCVRHCPIDYTPTERRDGQRFCKDPNSGNW